MIYNKEEHHLSYDIRQSYKPAKVHAVVSENKPKDTPRLKSEVWFTLLDLYQQTVPPINQPCSSCPLLSPPQMGHGLCFSHRSHQLSKTTASPQQH